MELTPEERRRIYEEEKARLEPRQEAHDPQPPQKGIGRWLILGFVVVFVILPLISYLGGSSSSSPRSSPSASRSGAGSVRDREEAQKEADKVHQQELADHARVVLHCMEVVENYSRYAEHSPRERMARE